MLIRNPLYTLFILVMLNFKVLLAGASTPYVIPKLESPINFDGKVDDPAWEAVEPLPLVTHWPTFGNKVDTGRTQIRIAHDKEYLYLSCRCYENPEKISAPTYKRNEIDLTVDGMGIALDIFNDNETGVLFTISPTGSRIDGTISNDAQGGFETSWDTYWEAETQMTDFGWTAEARIPFSSLRFESNNGKVEMGLIAYRYSAHNVTMEVYPPVEPNWGFFSFIKPSQAQNVILKGVESQTPVFITPYLLGGIQRMAAPDPQNESYLHENQLTHEVGVDAKIGLANNTTLDLTINTDFAQVEADNQQINLTRFSLFFPEQRQFFLERASVFDFSFDGPDRLFHSRRIGLHQGEPLRIWGGARMVTRSAGWDIGLLSMQTASNQELLSKNHSVVRVRKQVINPQSYAGGMLTSRIDKKGNYNLSYGLDGIFNIRKDDFLNVNIAQTTSSNGNSTTLQQESIRARANLGRRSYQGFSFNLNFNYSGELYEPVMGFQHRSNFTSFGDRLSWGWMHSDDSPLHRTQVSAMGLLFLDNETRSRETSMVGPTVNFTWKRGDFFSVLLVHMFENLKEPFHLADNVTVPAGSYQWPTGRISYHTPRGKSLRAIFSSDFGRFYDGIGYTAEATTVWDPSRIVNLRLFYQLNKITFSDRNQELTAHIARFRTEFTFNTQLTFSSFIQYNSAHDIGIINVRFRYNPRDGNNLYLVFNETINDNRDRITPRLPVSETRTVMLKLEYTF